MTKSEDLKIEMTDLFGGDVSEAKQAAERQEQLRAGGLGANVTEEEQRLFAEQEAERESRYQEMIRQRDEQLAREAQDFERKYQTPSDSLDAVPPETPLAEMAVEATPSLEARPVEEVAEEAFRPELTPAEEVAVVEASPEAPVPESVVVEAEGAGAPESAAEPSIEMGGTVDAPLAQETLEVVPEAGPSPTPPVPVETAPVELGAKATAPPDLINFDIPLMKPFGAVVPAAVLPSETPPAPPPIAGNAVGAVPSVPPPADAPVAATDPADSAQTAPSPVEPPGPSPEEIARIQGEHEYLLLYDQFRLIVLHELTDLVGERKAKVMLARTVETARNQNPEIFRNANWDPEGNLLEDGSLDEQRILLNKASLNPPDADTLQDIAMGALYTLRLNAIEKGLGEGLRSKIKTRYRQWLSERREKAKTESRETRPYDRLLNLAV